MTSQTNTGMGRREFIGAAARLLFAGVAIQVLGCGALTSADGEIIGQISDNPEGHVAIITKAELNDNGVGMTLHIQGSADHDHEVALTSTDMALIKSGSVVSRTSSRGGSDNHDHLVTFNSPA